MEQAAVERKKREKKAINHKTLFYVVHWSADVTLQMSVYLYTQTHIPEQISGVKRCHFFFLNRVPFQTRTAL